MTGILYTDIYGFGEKTSQFFIECKNLYGKITVDSKGDFTSTVQYGRTKKTEAIYSPITQNQRHMEAYRQVSLEHHGGVLRKLALDG